MAILTVTFPYSYATFNKVAVIKTIREISYMGLKEAKDLSEMSGPQEIIIGNTLSDQRLDDLCKILRDNGCIVGGRVHNILKELRELGSQALLMGEDNLANEILQLVLAEKLRRGPGQ
jgi:hypothetical protein